MSIERSIIQKLRESREVEDEDLLDEEFEEDTEDEEVLEENEDCEEEEIEEGRYTGTTTVRNIAKKVLQNHKLNNSTGKYDRFVNRVYNLYKETLLDEDELEAKMEREFKKMYPNIKEEKEYSPLEESILKKLTEAWAPSLNRLRKYDRDVVRKELTKAGIDIENTPYEEVVITNGRDPRLKGMNVVIFEMYRGEVAVWFNNRFIVDLYIYSEGRPISKLPWKTILSNATRIISIQFDEEAAQKLKAKQAGRKESQKGILQRFNWKTKPKYAKIDKSGYVINPNKYKDMLAKMKLNDAPKILQQAKDMYVKLAGKIDTIDFEMDREYYNYDTVMRGIVSEFQSLTRALGEYEKYKKNKKGADDVEKWWSDHLEGQVTKSIMNLREWLTRGKKYL